MLDSEILTLSALSDILTKAIGLTFAYAVVAKLAGFPALVAGIHAFELVPIRFASFAAVMLIVCESIIAVSHIGGIALRIAVPGTLLLLCAFAIVTAIGLIRGQKRPCLCFGANQDDQVDVHSLIRISVLLLCETGLFWYYGFVGVRNIGSELALHELALIVLVVSAPAVAIVGWCLAFPRFRRARAVLGM